MLLTAMYIASLISSTLLKMLLISMWILAIATFFSPNLIPEGYEIVSLMLIAFAFGIAAAILKFRSKRLARNRVEDALSEMLRWMKESGVMSPETRLDDRYIRYKLKEIMRKNKLC